MPSCYQIVIHHNHYYNEGPLMVLFHSGGVEVRSEVYVLSICLPTGPVWPTTRHQGRAV